MSTQLWQRPNPYYNVIHSYTYNQRSCHIYAMRDGLKVQTSDLYNHRQSQNLEVLFNVGDETNDTQIQN